MPAGTLSLTLNFRRENFLDMMTLENEITDMIKKHNIDYSIDVEFDD